MIRSMTGVGRAETTLARNKTKLIVEIRSANHKFMELNMKLPVVLASCENKVRELISEKIYRGSLQMAVSIHGINNEDIGQNNGKYNRVLGLDFELLSNLLSLTRQLKKQYKITGELDVNTILQYPGMIVAVKPEEQERKNTTWLKARRAIIKALNTLNQMKKEEGVFLYKDFMRRVQKIALHLKNIEQRSKIIRKELQVKAVLNSRNHRDLSAEQMS